MKKQSQGMPLATQLTVELLPLRFSFAINRLFFLVGWNVGEQILVRFCRSLLQRYAAVTFVSFNYDLLLEHAIEAATNGTWSATTGYGMTFSEFVNIEEANAHMPHQSSIGSGGAGGTLPSHRITHQGAESTFKILKPHGSLDWLCKFSGNYNFVGLPTHLTLSSDETVSYIGGFNVELLARPAASPWPNAGVFIFPPTAKIPIRTLLSQEEDAVVEADDVIVIGWSAHRQMRTR